MDITPVIPNGKQLIEGYSEAGFRISGTLHSGGVLVCDNTVWPLGVDTLAELTVKDFLLLLDLDVPANISVVGNRTSSAVSYVRITGGTARPWSNDRKHDECRGLPHL